MKTAFRIYLGIIFGALAFTACDALTPAWSEVAGISGVNPRPNATCDAVCLLQGSLCLEESCDGGTLKVDGDVIPTACDDPIWAVVSDDPSWSGNVQCCCGSI